MPTAIVMPKLGMTMEEGMVREWPLPLGSPVEKGETVLVIESEKAEVEIPATVSGFFSEVYVQVGETVPCGTLLGAITASADEAFDREAFRRAHEGSAGQRAPVERRVSEPIAKSAPARARRRAVAPAARALARRLDVDLDRVSGTGPGGRVVRADVEAWVARYESLVEVADGIRLETPSSGNGELVLFLPGFGFDVSSFRFQAEALATSYRVVGVNPRGVGLSDAPELEAYEVETAAEDVARVAGAPAHVVGASLGAAVALELACAHPELVRSLTLITPFLEAQPRLLAVLDAWCALARETSADSLARALLPWLFSQRTLADEPLRERNRRGLLAAVGRVPATSLERTAAGLRSWSGRRIRSLEGLACPTLVIVAEDDLLVPDAEEVAQTIAGSVTLRVPEAGHAVAVEAAAEVNEALLEQLERG